MVCGLFRPFYLQKKPKVCNFKSFIHRTLANTKEIRYSGPLARIGPNHLITNDPHTFRRILAARSNYHRGRWFDCLRLDPNNANLITERDWPRHNTLRQQMAPGVGIL